MCDVLRVHVHAGVSVAVCLRAGGFLFVLLHITPPLLRPSLDFFSSVHLTLTFSALAYTLSPFHPTHRIKIRSSAFRPH